ncbi:DEAD/DEAH box helicase [uncultured Nostoc sp.]|uniref:DEAD/DEAH box helicase n=1 Tax=uncultured Nostoc sp. TaxID=340711 RepID=UPI0035C9FABD
MPNPHPKTEQLPKQKTTWNNLPTKPTRVPEIFLEEIEKYARSLDNGSSPLDSVISALDRLSKDELSQLKLAVSSLCGDDDLSVRPVRYPIYAGMESEHWTGEDFTYDDEPAPKPQQNNLNFNFFLNSVKSWQLEDVVKLQLELPAIIDEKKEETADRRLERAICYLSSRCDGASSIDGQGFNKADSGFGHWLANQIQQQRLLLQAHAQAAYKMIQKYSKQLSLAGLSLPLWDVIAHQYALNSAPVIITQENTTITPEHRVEIKGEMIAVYAPYDKSGKFQRDCKDIVGYKFEGEDKSWRFPLLKIEEVIEKLTNNQFHLTPEVEGAKALAQKQRHEEEQAMEAAALAAADGIVQLVKRANLDAPLANGWYLRDYQKKGVEWLLAHRRGGIYTGGILADHMGLGKSLEALIAARAMQVHKGCPVFVIAPVSVMENWVKEAARAEVKIECFSWAKMPKPLDTQKYVLICDEAHYAQNINSQRTKKMLELAHHENCLASWLLTGTPIKNGRPVNLYPLLFAVNHPLAADKWAYERHYCNAGHKYVGKKAVWDNTGAAHLDELAYKTEDVILRRTKAECLTELPAKTRLFKEAECEASAAKSYQETIRSLVDDYRRRAKLGEVDENAEALVTLNFLRKVGSEFKVQSAIALAEELLEQGQQVVMFTEFVESAKAIAQGLGGLLLTGDTKPTVRQELVDQFQSGDNNVFVGTIKAGGVGLTLTAASNVILVDRAWTPGDCEQAEDRCHRLGQENAVFATWLQLGNIDKAIDDLLIQKQQRIELVLKGKRKTLQGINSPKDLAKELLAIL